MKHALSGFSGVVMTLAALCASPAFAAAEPVAADAVSASPATPIAVAIRSSVSGKLKDFYRPRGYWPLWAQDGAIGEEADRLIDLIETADTEGLNPSDYDPKGLRKLIEKAREEPTPANIAKAELRLSRAFASYVSDTRGPPGVKMVYLDQELVPEPPSQIAVLRAAGVAPSFLRYMTEMGWASPVYAKLRDALVAYQTDWGDLPSVHIAAGPTLRSGSKGDRVRLMRMRLGLAPGDRFDKEAAARLRAFQTMHGMKADGIAGKGTIAALNNSPQYYERLIRLNLERARVIPSPRRRHILVDAAAARLWLYEDGEAKDTMRVVVGQPTQPTPMLAGMMRYVVVNPYWNVPPDLVQRRIAPRVLKGEASLSGLRYEALSDWTHDAHVLNQSEIDWQSVAAGGQTLRLRQLPGGNNAMGRVKFMFPNDLGIYLHDTPDKALFKEDDRRFSSGCVRVEDAARLAEWLFRKPLEPKTGDPEEQIYLPEPVPVYITYLTASPTDKGIAFREDAYGRDGDEEARLAGHPVAKKRPVG